MKNKTIRKSIASLMLAGAVMFSLPFSAYASESGDSTLVPQEHIGEVTEQTGSIHISLSDGGQGTSKEGVIFSYTQVADIKNGEYVELEKYNSGVDFTRIETAEDLEQSAKTMQEHVKEADGEVKTDSNGKADIKDLKVGVYLLNVKDKAKYENITPTLVAIPTWDEKAGNMLYDVEVIPKHSPETPKQETPPTAPQTNVQSKAPLFFGISIFLVGASGTLLIINNRNKKKHVGK
jgi:hypothetical protein